MWGSDLLLIASFVGGSLFDEYWWFLVHEGRSGFLVGWLGLGGKRQGTMVVVGVLLVAQGTLRKYPWGLRLQHHARGSRTK